MYASRLLTTDAMLNTNEQNQKLLTVTCKVVFASLKENCSVVAVTAEKNVPVDKYDDFPGVGGTKEIKENLPTVDSVRKLVAA